MSESTEAVSGRAATEDQLASVAAAVGTANSNLTNATFGVTAGDNNSVTNTVNNKISIVGGTVTSGTAYKADNLTTAVVNGAVQIQMKESPTFKDITATNGTNTVTVSGTNGTVSGLTNTSWTDNTSGTGTRAGVAATEGQLASVKSTLGTSISANTTAINNNTSAISTLQGGFNVIGAASGSGTVSGNTSTAVKAGNTVTYTAGDNLELTQDGSTFTYALNPTVTLGSTVAVS